MKQGLSFALAAIIGVSASAATAENYKVERTLQVSTSAEKAWHVVGDFCDIDDWHPAVASCRLKVIDGSLHRVLVLADGAEFVEKRIAVDPGLSYTYTIVSSPLPIEDYFATLSVDRGDGVTITWSGQFSSETPDMEGVIGGIYDAGLASIEGLLAE